MKLTEEDKHAGRKRRPGKNRQPYTIRLDRELIRKAKTVASFEDVKLSDLIEGCLEELISEYDSWFDYLEKERKQRKKTKA